MLLNFFSKYIKKSFIIIQKPKLKKILLAAKLRKNAHANYTAVAGSNTYVNLDKNKGYSFKEIKDIIINAIKQEAPFIDFNKLNLEIADQTCTPFTDFSDKKTKEKYIFWDFVLKKIQQQNSNCKFHLLLTYKEEIDSTKENKNWTTLETYIDQKKTKIFSIC